MWHKTKYHEIQFIDRIQMIWAQIELRYINDSAIAIYFSERSRNTNNFMYETMRGPDCSTRQYIFMCRLIYKFRKLLFLIESAAAGIRRPYVYKWEFLLLLDFYR